VSGDEGVVERRERVVRAPRVIGGRRGHPPLQA
jgi:hypothetical protein